MTAVPGSPTVRRRRLAAELRGIRESKGKSGDAVAAALRWSPSKISRYERAKTGLQPREVERLLDYYEITGSRRDLLLTLAEDAAQKGWWEDYADSLSADYQQFIGLEDEASSQHLRNDFSLEGEKESYLHWIAFQMLAKASLDLDESRELILKTAQSHWSGSQRDT